MSCMRNMRSQETFPAPWFPQFVERFASGAWSDNAICASTNEVCNAHAM